MSRSVERVVHLDLKGAPPKIEYFDWLFPMLKRWGATGVLMEYEDMFPYNGKWSVLKQPHAYSLEDVRHIEEVASRNDLHIVPLIQTFGHLEFLLKHDVCASIREVPSSPQALCPLNEQSIVVVGELMQQVISAHRHIKYFHIGADEVNLGHCPRCRQTGDTTTLFFHHVRRVLNHLTQFRPDLHIIMWDDMFREVDVPALEAAGIGDLVQPMVWMYTPQLHFPEGMWERYMKVFSKLWVASAFKGASGVNQRATPISHHIENNKGWLFVVHQLFFGGGGVGGSGGVGGGTSVAKNGGGDGIVGAVDGDNNGDLEVSGSEKMELGEEQGVSCKFAGYAITGWSRYDHYQMLCELLPVGLPSLALCLLTLTHEAFTKEVHQMASQDLKFDGLIQMCPFSSCQEKIVCDFPGSKLFIRMHEYISARNLYCDIRDDEDFYKWSNPDLCRYTVDEIKSLSEKIHVLLSTLDELKIKMHDDLMEIFHERTCREWLEDNIRTLHLQMSQQYSLMMQYLVENGSTGPEPPKSPSLLH